MFMAAPANWWWRKPPGERWPARWYTVYQERYAVSSAPGAGAAGSLCTARGDHFNLHNGAHRQGCDGHRGAGRVGLAEIGLIDRVDGGKVGHVGEKNGGLDHVRQAQSRRCQNALEVLQALPGLGRNVAGNQLAIGGIERRLSRDKDQIAAGDRRRIGTNGRALITVNCAFCHDLLSSITPAAAHASARLARPSGRGNPWQAPRRQHQPTPPQPFWRQPGAQLASCGAIFFEASISAFTDSTDFKNICRSAGLRSISTIFSTP